MSTEQPNKLHGINDDVTDQVNDVTNGVVHNMTSQNTRNVVLPPISFQSSQKKKSPNRRALRRKKSKGGVLELDDAATTSG